MSATLGRPKTTWQSAALRLGEHLSADGPTGYYTFTPNQWLKWALVVAGWRPSRPRRQKPLEQERDELLKDVHEQRDRIVILERAVGNCFMMAKRQIAAHLNGASVYQKDLERWQHVLRFCETTGSKSDILRGQLPTEITEGELEGPAGGAPVAVDERSTERATAESTGTSTDWDQFDPALG